MNFALIAGGAALIALVAVVVGRSVRGTDDVPVELVPQQYVARVFADDPLMGEFGFRGPPADAAGLQLEMLQAGLYHPNSVVWFLVLKYGLAVVVPIYVWALGVPIPADSFWLAMLGLSISSWLLVTLSLELAIRSRHTALNKAFPDGLDMLVSCLEAGLSFDASIMFVGDQFSSFMPELGDELLLTSDHLTAGVPIHTALRGLADRTRLDAAASLVATVTQSARSNSNLAEALRVYARVSREKRFSVAEEQAGTLSSKLTVVMILFILPPLFVLLLSPALLQLYYEVM